MPMSQPARMRETHRARTLAGNDVEGRRYLTRDVIRPRHSWNEPLWFDVKQDQDIERFYNVVKATERPYLYKVFTTRQTFWPIPKRRLTRTTILSKWLIYVTRQSIFSLYHGMSCTETEDKVNVWKQQDNVTGIARCCLLPDMVYPCSNRGRFWRTT